MQPQLLVFANTPQMLGTNDLIDYSTKRGSTTFEQGCKPHNDKALTNGFSMTPNQTIIFVEVFHHCAMTIGWNQGTMQIALFANSAGHQVDIVKSYGQLTRPLSSLHVKGSVGLGESIPRPAQSRITQ
jgi:hypothetical protein